MEQQQQSQSLRTFILGTKEFEDKNSEFQYDRGWYSITDIVGEERTLIYKSRNANEAYMKWNVYIGRKKARAYANEEQHHRSDSHDGGSRGRGDHRSGRGSNRNNNKNNNHGQNRGKDGYRDSAAREERRDRRRNRGDRSRRDMEIARGEVTQKN